jgi:hypothetical protein
MANLSLTTLGDLAPQFQFLAAVYVGSPLAKLYGESVQAHLSVRLKVCQDIVSADLPHNAEALRLERVGANDLESLNAVLSDLASGSMLMTNFVLGGLHLLVSMLFGAVAKVEVDVPTALLVDVLLITCVSWFVGRPTIPIVRNEAKARTTIIKLEAICMPKLATSV